MRGFKTKDSFFFSSFFFFERPFRCFRFSVSTLLLSLDSPVVSVTVICSLSFFFFYGIRQLNYVAVANFIFISPFFLCVRGWGEEFNAVTSVHVTVMVYDGIS